MRTIIVSFLKSATESEIQEILERHNLNGVRASTLTKKYAVDLPREDPKMLAALGQEPLVEHIF